MCFDVSEKRILHQTSIVRVNPTKWKGSQVYMQNDPILTKNLLRTCIRFQTSLRPHHINLQKEKTER